MSNFREFSAGPDPFGNTWQVRFVWLQTAISIRHSDSIDVKFVISCGDGPEEKVIALMHPMLQEFSRQTGEPLTDAWCMKMAALHLRWMIETGEDMEKTLVTMSKADMERAHGGVSLAGV
jgi:hypothetical protein